MDSPDGRKGRPVTPEHKAAMIQGRTETRIVRHYLEALEGTQRPRGRRRSKETLEQKLADVEAELGTTSAVSRLRLLQERIDLQKALESVEQNVNIEELEEAFIEVASGWSERNGISYQAWRELGVSAKVLRAAGVN